MHAWNALAAVNGALGRVAPRPFQEELGPFTAAQSANRSNMTSHGGRATLDREEPVYFEFDDSA
jgi:hypothetical protein